MKFIQIIRYLSILLVMALWSGCGSSDQNEPAPLETPMEQEQASLKQVPTFNGDSAYYYVERQVGFGPRVPGSPGHKKTKEWISGLLSELADTVILQNFTAKTWDGKKLPSTNIIAVFNPEAQQRILLAAHWDTRAVADHDPDPEMRKKPILGADDGGSGVGVLLEIARQLKGNDLSIGIDLVLFDAEDQGKDGGGDMESWCLGSQYWSRNLHFQGYRAQFGILLDMVGSKNPRFTKEAISMNFAGNVMNRVWQIAGSMGYGGYFVNDQSGPITDDHYFVNTIAKIPMINIINRPAVTNTGFGAYWHTHADNMEVIEKRSLKVVGQLLLQVLYKVDEGTF